MTLCFVCYVAMNIFRPFEFIFRWPGTREYSQCLMKWAAQDIGTENSRKANDRFQSFHCCFSDRGISADGVGLGSGNRYGRSLELQFIQFLSQFFVVDIVTTEDWDFNTVESGRFDLFQMGIVLLGHMSGPEQQVHADFHSWGMSLGHLDELFQLAGALLKQATKKLECER